MIMQEERIRLSSTDSVNSVNKENFLDVEIKQHTKVFPFGDTFDTIDQREQFETERNKCTKYRLILTVKPYCTNVLFNPITEIVQNEGSDNVNDLVFVNVKSDGIRPSVGDDYEIKGKARNVTNYDMIRNTEYANGSKPFKYHCGFDIFNNHILRNQSFRLVNAYTSSSNRDVFNTIEDYMRDANGDVMNIVKRTNVNTITIEEKKRHLYMKEDVLSFEDSINANLFEQNGWWGFNNRSSIMTTEWDEVGKEWKDMYTAKVFNDEDSLACGFIEMYPDSTLYSFSPKYNKFQNREEHNWDICITYPYKNDYGISDDGNIVKSLINGKINGNIIINALLLASATHTKGTSGQDIILFRSYVKHNLKVGDKFKLFFSQSLEDNFIEIEEVLFDVVNIGNLENDYQEYYFYINNVTDVFESIGGEDIKGYFFRFVKVSNGYDCKYYYRKFKKLPNFKFKKRDLTDEDVEGDLEAYIKGNCADSNEKMLLFNREQYPLAFSNTVYGDGNTQIVFTDSIEIDKLTDNLGRPLTEIYMTFIKRNKGHKLWYSGSSLNAKQLKEIEFSHCFTKVISGLQIHIESTDDTILRQYRGQLSDVTCITNTQGKMLNDDIDIDTTDTFYGDLVELDQSSLTETTISDVCFRFNTEQRETGGVGCGDFKYDEIETDDYDFNSFNCIPNDLNDNVLRPEGYYYKAHYPIKVRGFGPIMQGSYREISISSCKPKQSNGLFIEVVSTQRSGVTTGSVICLYDTTQNNKKVAELTVNSVQNNVRFLLNPMKREDSGYISIFDIVKRLLYSVRTVSNGEKWINEYGLEEIYEASSEGETREVNDYGNPQYIMRLKNIDIPNYAYEVGENSNVFLWRDVLNVGNKDAIDLTEYPFANGHFYINQDINFFLKRQDPFGYNGLYAKNTLPNDIYGNVMSIDIYEYKDESNVVC